MHEFYGPADPEYGSWWKVPSRKFWAYVRMMPIIRARNAIQEINLMAAAFGSLDQNTSAELSADLQRRASKSGLGPRARRPASADELAELGGGTTKVVME